MTEYRIVVLVWLTYWSVIPEFATFSLTFFSAGSKYVWKPMDCLTLNRKVDFTQTQITSMYFCTIAWTSLSNRCWIFCRINSMLLCAISNSLWCIELRPLYRRRSCFSTTSLNSLFGNFYKNHFNLVNLFLDSNHIYLLFHLLQSVGLMESNLLPFAMNCSNLRMMIYVARKSFQSIGSYLKPSFKRIIYRSLVAKIQLFFQKEAWILIIKHFC